LKLLIPIVAWTLALATLAGASHELRHQRESADSRAALASLPRLSVSSQAATLSDYQAIQKKTAVFGTVGLIAGQNALVIKATALSDYAAWRLTIDQVLLDNPSIRWRIDSLCSGQCASGEVHKAVLSGRRVAARLQEKAEESSPINSLAPGNS
jgi:predicted NAD/FAD-dependent oxidoreductase